MKSIIFTTLSLCWGVTLLAQINFQNQTTLFANQFTASGAPIGVCDMNGDFRDDVLRLHDRQFLTIEYQNADGTFTPYLHGQIAAGTMWAMAAADVNNDGHSDIVVGDFSGVDMATSNGDGTYSNVSLNGPDYFVQGMSFGDVDTDGELDIYVCNDVGISNIWQNDGNGNLLSSDGSLIDFELFPGGDEPNSGNYGSTWTDFDSDGDMDLYISKCRLGVTDPADHRRINKLWVNDGSNNFTENASAYGLDIGEQSWVAEFQDIDNDGDLDVYVGNHTGTSNLFENQNGMYVDIAVSSGIAAASGPPIIQASMKDFDNDGFVDLLVSNMLFHNNGDKTFTEIPNPLGSVHSFGIGDLNQDGFLDVYAGYALGFNSPSSTNYDKLWINDGNNNNYLAVNLKGTTSNPSAIGARLELHGAWGIMTREVRAGESYGVTHSLTQHFGLGQYFDIDQLVIKWPSGLVETFDDITPNQFLMVVEGECISSNIEIATTGATTICTGDNIEMEVNNSNLSTFSWNNGFSTPIISVNSTGNYNVTVTDALGCQGISDLIEVVIDDANCTNTCSSYLNLFGHQNSDTYNVQHYIKSIGTVQNTENVSFLAGECVLLNAGFEVQLGAEFLGDIQACTPN